MKGGAQKSVFGTGLTGETFLGDKLQGEISGSSTKGLGETSLKVALDSWALISRISITAENNSQTF